MSDIDFDVRVVEFNIRRGTVKREEYQKLLDKLPDETEEGEETETRFADPFDQRHYKAEDAESEKGE